MRKTLSLAIRTASLSPVIDISSLLTLGGGTLTLAPVSLIIAFIVSLKGPQMNGWYILGMETRSLARLAISLDMSWISMNRFIDRFFSSKNFD